MKKSQFFALLGVSLLLAEPSLAQTIGGQGPLSPLVNWITANLIPALGVIVIIAIGIGLAVSRMGGAVFAICGIAGIWIAANAQTLYNTFVGGG